MTEADYLDLIIDGDVSEGSLRRLRNIKLTYGNVGGTSCTLFQWAARFGQVPTMRVLLASGARPDTVNDRGETPLHLAAFNGHVGAVKLLLSSGVMTQLDLDAEENRDITPLMYAVMGNVPEIVKALLEAGASTEGISKKTGDTALHLAAIKGNLEVIDMLLKAGSNPVSQNKKRHTIYSIVKIKHPSLLEQVKHHVNMHCDQPAPGTRVFENKASKPSPVAALFGKVKTFLGQLGACGAQASANSSASPSSHEADVPLEQTFS